MEDLTLVLLTFSIIVFIVLQFATKRRLQIATLSVVLSICGIAQTFGDVSFSQDQLTIMIVIFMGVFLFTMATILVKEKV